MGWATPTRVTSGRFGAGNTSKTTSNFVPPASTLLLASLAVFTNNQSFTPTISDSIGGLSWTNITAGWVSLAGTATYLRTDIWWAFTGPSPPGVGTVTFGENVSYEGDMEVYQFPGAAPVSPIGATGSNTDSTAGDAALSVTLSAAPAASSLVFTTYVDNFSSQAQPSLPSGYTLLDYDAWNLGFNLEAAYGYDASSPGSSVSSWGFAALPAGGFGVQSIAVEILAAPVPPPKLTVVRQAVPRASGW